MNLHEAISSVIPARSRRSSYQGSPRFTFDCPVCVQQGQTRDKRGRGAIFLDHDGSAGYFCFNCDTRTRQYVDKPLATKMRLVLNALGMRDEEITKLNFHLQAAAWAKNNRPAVSLPTGLQSIQDWIDQDCEDLALLKIAEMLVDDGERKLTDYYWTPGDNGMDLSQYIVTIYGIPTHPTGWWAFPLLGDDLPQRNEQGVIVIPEEVELEIPPADLEELRRFVFAEDNEDSE
jgi:hypothetical protein